MKKFIITFCVLGLALVGEASASAYSLYLVAWRGEHSTKWMADVIEKSVQGGVSAVQLDEPALDFATYVAYAKEVRRRLEPYGVPLIINTRIDVAKVAGADGVHFMSYSPAVFLAAKKVLGADAIVGFSALSFDEIADNTTADYVSFGPIFPSRSHPHLTPWEIEGLEKALSLSTKPVVACGGIRHENAEEAIRAGANGVVVVSSIVNAEDPAAAAHEYRMVIDSIR